MHHVRCMCPPCVGETGLGNSSDGGGGAGGGALLLAFILRRLPTHPFRDGALSLLLYIVETCPTSGRSLRFSHTVHTNRKVWISCFFYTIPGTAFSIGKTYELSWKVKMMGGNWHIYKVQQQYRCTVSLTTGPCSTGHRRRKTNTADYTFEIPRKTRQWEAVLLKFVQNALFPD